MEFGFVKLRGRGKNWATLSDELKENVFPKFEGTDVSLWGAWYGVFGLGTDELFVVTVSEEGQKLADLKELYRRHADVVEARLWLPTVRPTGPAPCTKPGLYVFRSYEVVHEHTEKVASLSQEVWKSFEAADYFNAEPQGLFRPVGQGGATGIMTLVTWYDGLSSWQESRKLPPEALEAVKKRREFIRRSVPIATRLVEGLPG